MAQGTQITIDSEVTINGENPIQGSVSLSLDESDMVVAKYEGGKIAGVKGRIKYNLKASFFGAGSEGVATGQTVTMAVSGSSFALSDCLLITTTGWSSDTGFTHEINATGYAASASE